MILVMMKVLQTLDVLILAIIISHLCEVTKKIIDMLVNASYIYLLYIIATLFLGGYIRVDPGDLFSWLRPCTPHQCEPACNIHRDPRAAASLPSV